MLFVLRIKESIPGMLLGPYGTNDDAVRAAEGVLEGDGIIIDPDVHLSLEGDGCYQYCEADPGDNRIIYILDTVT